MQINFITSNKGKVREFREILKEIAKVKHIEISYPELRSDDQEEIARLAAKQLADLMNKTVVVEDSGLFIEALNGFPGTCSAYIHKRIGLAGIIKLMQGVKNRKCKYRSAVGFCIPGREPVSFLGEEDGFIAEKIRGSYGFGHDPIFIPKGSKKTYGGIKNCEKAKKFRRRAVMKLVRYLRRL